MSQNNQFSNSNSTNEKISHGSTEGRSENEEKKSVLVNAIKMAFGTLSSRFLGLVRDIAFTAFFPRPVTDAWTAAFRLPNLFRRLLGEGSLSVSFIPIFVEARLEDEKNGTHEAQNLVNGFYSCLLVLLSVLTGIGILKAELILSYLLDPIYISNTEKFLLTVRMAQIMFGFIFLMSHFAYYMGILNALGEYSLPALAPVFFNIAMIVSVFIPQKLFTSVGDGLAWGVMVGGLWQAGILIPSLIRKGYWPQPILRWKNPKVLKVFKNMVPGLLGTGILQMTTIINLRYASRLGEGAISYIYLADRLLELPLSLVAVSLGTALLPTLSKMWSEGNRSQLLETSQHYLRLNLFVCLPAAVGLFSLSRPMVEVLFKRMHFVNSDVDATSMVVSLYSFILIASSSVRVLVPLYYAMKNTWWPSVVGLICLVVHFFLAPALMKEWGLSGLVLSSFVSAMLNFICLAIPIHTWVGPMGWLKVFKSFFINLFASIIMGLIVFFLNQSLKVYLGEGELGRFLNLVLSILVGGVFFVVVAQILRSAEMKEIMNLLKTRILKRKS